MKPFLCDERSGSDLKICWRDQSVQSSWRCHGFWLMRHRKCCTLNFAQRHVILLGSFTVLESKTFADQLLCWMSRRQVLIYINRPLFRYDPLPPKMWFIELCTRSALIIAKMQQFLRFGHKSWREYPCQNTIICRRKGWFMSMDDKRRCAR